VVVVAEKNKYAKQIKFLHTCKGREDREGRGKVRGGIREEEGTPP